MDPAVGLGILIPALADDGPPVQVVLQEDEEQPEHDHECGGLENGCENLNIVLHDLPDGGA